MQYLTKTICTVLISTIISMVFADYLYGWYQTYVAESSVMDEGMMQYHPRLGWKLSSNWHGNHHHHNFDVSYTTDRNGHRTVPETGKMKPLKKIAILGDSFTFGIGVNDNENFVSQLAAIDTKNQYLNLGIPGYSTDQQYLFLVLNHSRIAADHYVLMFYLGNDILDNTLAYPLQAEPAKPFFIVSGDSLILKNVPVPKKSKPAVLKNNTLRKVVFGDELERPDNPANWLIRKSHILRSLLPQNNVIPPEKLNTILRRNLHDHEKLLDRLLKEMKEKTDQFHVKFSVAVLPGNSYINSPDSYSAVYQEFVRKRLLGITKRLHIETVDIAGSMRQEKDKTNWFHANEGHLTRTGNQFVAERLHSFLKK